MRKEEYVLEVAIFSVKEAFVEEMPRLRAGLRTAFKNFSGLIERQTFSPVDESGMFADITKWETPSHARGAAEAFESGDAHFLPNIDAIESVSFPGHFKS